MELITVVLSAISKNVYIVLLEIGVCHSAAFGILCKAMHVVTFVVLVVLSLSDITITQLTFARVVLQYLVISFSNNNFCSS